MRRARLLSARSFQGPGDDSPACRAVLGRRGIHSAQSSSLRVFIKKGNRGIAPIKSLVSRPTCRREINCILNVIGGKGQTKVVLIHGKNAIVLPIHCISEVSWNDHVSPFWRGPIIFFCVPWWIPTPTYLLGALKMKTSGADPSLQGATTMLPRE